MNDNSVNLELFLTDKTAQGMQSAGQNMSGLEQQMKDVIAVLKQELTGLSKAFKEALSTGTSNPSDFADIEAMRRAIAELEQQIKDLKKEASGGSPKFPKVIDLAPYVTEEVNKLEDARERVKMVIANIQKDIDTLRSHSVTNASNGIVNTADEAKIKSLESTVRGLTEELKKYEIAKQSANETPIIQGDPAPKLNSVKMSMAQIARELPALAMGPQMFFLAISNNIPIFTDALTSARTEYERLTAAGQRATPVWRQALMSLFSWQTAMSAAITLSVVYGKEIGNWIKSLFTAKTATNELLNAEQEMALARSKALDATKKERAELDILYTKLKDTTISSKERTAATNEWIRKHPEYANVLDREKIDISALETAYKSLSKEIYATAVARAYADKIEDNSVKKDKELLKAQNQYVTYLKAQESYNKSVLEFKEKEKSGFGTATAKTDAEKRIEKLRRNMNEEYSLWEDYRKNVKQYGENITTIEKHLNAADLFKQPDAGTYDYWTQQKKNAEEVLKNIKSNVKETLDAAAGKGKDLFSLGIDKSVVESYKKAVSDISKAKEGLATYDNLNKGYEAKQKKEADRLREQEEKKNENMLSLRRKNQQDEAKLMEEGTEKKLALIKADYDAQEQEIDKRERELVKRNKEVSAKGVNGSGLTTDQQAEIDRARKLNKDTLKKQEAEVYRDELQSMWDYLKAYGTFMQQKLAIAEEYNDKIARLGKGDEWQKKTLEAERDAKINDIEIKAVKQSVDWGSVFGDFGTMFKDQLQPTIDKLRAISNSDEFRTSPLQDQQILYDLIKKLEQSNAAWDSDIFKRVSEDMIAYQSAVQGSIEALERQANAEKTLAAAKENLKRVEASGGDTTQAKVGVKQAEEAFNSASEDVRDFGGKVKGATSDLESSSAKAVAMFQTLEGGLQGLTSGSLKGIGNGLMQLDKLFSEGEVGDLTAKVGNTLAKGFQSLLGKDSKASKAITEALGSTGMTGQIISAILGILDVIGKVGISGIITGLQDTIFNSIEKMLSDVLSGDIIVKPLKNAVDHVGNILNTITFGGFKSWTHSGNEKETADKIAALTASNESLKTSIDALKNEIAGTNGSKTISAYNEARDAQKRYEENLRKILDAQMGYHSSHHSNSYYWDLKDSSLNEVNKLLGTRLKDSWSDFASLTADQMYDIRTHLPDIWAEMIDQGKYGDRFKDDWNNYADQSGKVKELTDNLRESLAQVSFSSLRDSFVDKLMDMRADASAFADDFKEYMQRALLNFSIGDMLDKDLKKWYESWTDAMNSQKGDLTDEQIENYRKQWDDMVAKGLAERDKIAELTGYNGGAGGAQQSGRAGSYSTLTQEQGTKLEGLFTSVQDHTSSIDQLLKDAQEERKLEMEVLGKIEENTSFCRLLATINDNIESLHRDGFKMKG